MALKKRTAPKSTLGKVDQAVKRSEEKRKAGQRRFLSVGDGEIATVRVLDVGQDWKDMFVHRVQFEREDESVYFRDVPCLDQDEKGVPCPGCKGDLDRRYKFWTNVIVRDWEDEESGKSEDVVMVLSGGVTLANKLAKMDAKHGLRNRDVEISREGQKKSTKWDADWADDENVPLTAADKELEKSKSDLSFYTEIPDFEDFYKPPSKRGKDDDDDNEEVGRKAKSRNVLKRSRTADSSDDDDEPKPKRGVKRTGTGAARSSADKPKFGPKAGSAKKSKTVVRRRAR